MKNDQLTRPVWVQLVLGAILAALPQPCAAQAAVRPAVSAQAVSDTGTLAAGAFRLQYRIEGTGRPTIVIGSAAYYPRVFSQALRKQLRLVFVDHRGFAPSPGHVDTTEFALEKLVDDVERARQELRLGRIAVIGHSGHALMALEYAKKYPANTTHVIMVAMAPNLSPAIVKPLNATGGVSSSPL